IGTHSQRSAEQCAFRVISGKRISGKEPIDITRFDESHQMLTGVGSDDGRADDHGNFSFRCMRTMQFARELANDGRFRFVGIDDCVDELKNIRARGCALHRYNAHTLVTDHDLVTLANVEELNSSGAPSFSIDRYSAVHHGWLHFDFLAVDADECLLIRRHVEIGRENSVGRRGGNLRICALQNFGTLLTKTQDQFVERFDCLGGHLNSGKTLIGPFLSDVDLSDLKVGPAGQNLIQHFWQDEGINNMPAQLDRLGVHLKNLPNEHHRASGAKLLWRGLCSAFKLLDRRSLRRAPLQLARSIWKSLAPVDLRRAVKRITHWDPD